MELLIRWRRRLKLNESTECNPEGGITEKERKPSQLKDFKWTQRRSSTKKGWRKMRGTKNEMLLWCEKNIILKTSSWEVNIIIYLCYISLIVTLLASFKVIIKAVYCLTDLVCSLSLIWDIRQVNRKIFKSHWKEIQESNHLKIFSFIPSKIFRNMHKYIRNDLIQREVIWSKSENDPKSV